MQSRIANRRLRAGGFTLIEIMVVVVIIGLLATMVAVNVIPNVDTAAINKARQDIRTLENAVNLFRVDHFRYPTEEEGLQVLTGRAAAGGDAQSKQYINRLPNDPWDRAYLYANPSDHGQQFDVYTLGADGEEGGDGVDADIGNWNLED